MYNKKVVSRRNFLKNIGYGSAVVIGAAAFPKNASAEMYLIGMGENWKDAYVLSYFSYSGPNGNCSCNCTCTCVCSCNCSGTNAGTERDNTFGDGLQLSEFSVVQARYVNIRG